jgi:hypothetical protein
MTPNQSRGAGEPRARRRPSSAAGRPTGQDVCGHGGPTVRPLPPGGNRDHRHGRSLARRRGRQRRRAAGRRLTGLNGDTMLGPENSTTRETERLDGIWTFVVDTEGAARASPGRPGSTWRSRWRAERSTDRTTTAKCRLVMSGTITARFLDSPVIRLCAARLGTKLRTCTASSDLRRGARDGCCVHAGTGCDIEDRRSPLAPHHVRHNTGSRAIREDG